MHVILLIEVFEFDVIQGRMFSNISLRIIQSGVNYIEIIILIKEISSYSETTTQES